MALASTAISLACAPPWENLRRLGTVDMGYFLRLHRDGWVRYALFSQHVYGLLTFYGFGVAWYNEDNYLMKSCDTPVHISFAFEIAVLNPVTERASKEVLSASRT